MDKSDGNKYAVLQILNQLKVIHERFKQSKGLVEKAKQHLSAQKNFTATQCKRATQPFFELDDSIGKLYDLLKQRPLPESIDTQRHSISLTLGKLRQCKDELPDHINVFSPSNRLRNNREEIRNKQDEFIAFIQISIEQLDELISVLDIILVSAMSSALMGEQDVKEADLENDEQEPVCLTSVPFQSSDPSTSQNSYSHLKFVFILIGSMLNILIGLFTPKKTHTRLPLGISETTQVDVPNAMPEIVDGNPLPGIIVPIVATEVRYEGSFEFLYGLLRQHVEPVELAHICRKLKIDHQSLDDKSHETRAYSLTEKMENQNRLEELELELRERLPKRFHSSHQQ